MIEITDGDYRAEIADNGRIFVRSKGTALMGWITHLAIESDEALTLRTVLDRAIALAPRVKVLRQEYDKAVKHIDATADDRRAEISSDQKQRRDIARHKFEAELKAIEAYA